MTLLRNLIAPVTTRFRSSPTTTTTFQTISSRYHNHKNMSTIISLSLLKQQNAETSNALIDHWKTSDVFAQLAKYEGDLTIQRDNEDAVKLEKGVDFAKNKGVIDPKYVPEPYVNLDVLGKTPTIVADEILAKVQANATTTTSGEGSVIVLCGLSGTGKVRITTILCT
jgi:hypothetical protein